MSNDPLGDEFDGIEMPDIDEYNREVEREQIREINERNSTWEQERRLDWFVGAGLLFLLLAGWYFNKILAVWK